MSTQDTSTTKYALATECGSSGTYRIGVEYQVDTDGTHRLIRRPRLESVFLAYAIQPDGVQTTVTSFGDGPVSEWRMEHIDGRIEVIDRPLAPPYLGLLPDEEHGATWGDPIDIAPSAPRLFLGACREISEDEAMAAIATYNAAHPEQTPQMPPGWEDRAVERARREGVLR